MPTYVKVGGEWRQVSTVYTRVGGVWQPTQAWVKVGGVWKNCSFALPSEHTLTVGNDNQSSPPLYTLVYYGFNDGASGAFNTIGSISPTTFTDSSGAIRTFAVLASFFYQDDITTETSTFLWLSGSVPNTNETFQRLKLVGVGDLIRTDASFSESGGYSIWTWAGQYISAGPLTVRVLFDASQS